VEVCVSSSAAGYSQARVGWEHGWEPGWETWQQHGLFVFTVLPVVISAGDGDVIGRFNGSELDSRDGSGVICRSVEEPAADLLQRRGGSAG
jgi:hypothetical protein